MRTVSLLGHSFVPALASRARIAFDCGANQGMFSAWLSEHTGATVYAFEPDPRLFRELPPLPRVHYIPQAIDGESGTLELALGVKMCSSAVIRTPAQEVVTVRKTSLADFCREQGIAEIDFLKVDIEGSEVSVFEQASDETLRSINQITVEFHDMFRPEDVPRIKLIVARLKRLGFFYVRFTQFTWGDCLFINKRRTRLGALDKTSLVVLGKYAPGIPRLVRRIVGV